MRPNSFSWFSGPERLPTGDDRHAVWYRQKFLHPVLWVQDGGYREVDAIIHGFVDDYGDFVPRVGWPKAD